MSKNRGRPRKLVSKISLGAVPPGPPERESAPHEAAPDKPAETPQLFEPAADPTQVAAVAGSESSAESRGPGRPPSAARCEKCGAPVYACKCAEPQLLTEQTAEAMLRGIGKLLAFGAMLAAKIPSQEAIAIWGFSDGELALLRKPVAQVASKYLPEWVATHQAEFMLACLFAPMLAGRLHQTAETVRQRNEKARQMLHGANGEAKQTERQAAEAAGSGAASERAAA